MRRSTVVSTVILLLLVGGLVFWFGPGFLAKLLLIPLGMPVLTTLIIAGAVVSVLFLRSGAAAARAEELSKKHEGATDESRALKRRSHKLGVRAWGVLLVGAALVAAGVFLLPWFRASSLTQSYTSSDTVPSYQDRAPFVVANELSNRDLDDIIGDRVGVHAVQSAQAPGQYTTLVIRRGLFQGYEAVQTITPPLLGAGQSTSTACRFDEAHSLRLDGGIPSTNLDRAIGFLRPFAFWDETDTYGYCDGDEPVVVVPLKRYGGVWPAMTERPAGVAVYRGGQVTTYDADAVPDDLVGPTYPRSIAAAQREASRATGSFSDWVFKRAGFDTGGEDSDENPNRTNPVDFTLTTSEGEGHFTTALTPVGASESVVAVGHVSSQQTSGDLNDFVITRYDEALPAMTTTENRIRSDFSHLPGWASGMKVMEIIPSTDGTYVASIGQSQVVTYRVRMAPDGSLTLIEAADDTEPGAASESPIGDVSGMSTAEISEAIRILTEELASRAEDR